MPASTLWRRSPIADLSRDWRTDSLRDGLNTILGQADARISIIAAEAMPETWNARLSAVRRRYRYRIAATAGSPRRWSKARMACPAQAGRRRDA